MASPNPLDPDVEEELRLRFNMPVRTVLCTPASINEAIAKYLPRDATTAPPPAAPDPATAAAPAAAAPAEAAPAAPAKPTGPMTEDEKKQRRDIAIVAAMGTGIVTINALLWGMRMGVVMCILLGCTAAAIAGGIAWKMKSR